MPSTRCISRLTQAMLTQQQRPTKMGFMPLFTSLTMLVFRPIAAIAMTIKNLLSVLNGTNTLAGTPAAVQTVLMTDASTKKRIK